MVPNEVEVVNNYGREKEEREQEVPEKEDTDSEEGPTLKPQKGKIVKIHGKRENYFKWATLKPTRDKHCQSHRCNLPC